MQPEAGRQRSPQSLSKAKTRQFNPRLIFDPTLARPKVSYARGVTRSAKNGEQLRVKLELISGLQKIVKETDELSDLSNLQQDYGEPSLGKDSQDASPAGDSYRNFKIGQEKQLQ